MGDELDSRRIVADDVNALGRVAARAGESGRDAHAPGPLDPGDFPGVVDPPRVVVPEVVVLEQDLAHQRPATFGAALPDLGEPGAVDDPGPRIGVAVEQDLEILVAEPGLATLAASRPVETPRRRIDLVEIRQEGRVAAQEAVPGQPARKDQVASPPEVVASPRVVDHPLPGLQPELSGDVRLEGHPPLAEEEAVVGQLGRPLRIDECDSIRKGVMAPQGVALPGEDLLVAVL